LTSISRAIRIRWGRGGNSGPALLNPDQFPQVRDNRVEDVGIDPASGLVIDRLPGRQVMGQVAPLKAGAGNEPESLEELTQGMVAVGGILAHEGEVRCPEGPFLIRHV